MNGIYELNLQIKHGLKEIADISKKLVGLNIMKGAFTVATFFIYLSFTSVLFAGVSIWGLQDYLIKHGANYIALIWVIVVIFSVPLALALGKHFNYESIGDSFTKYNAVGMVIYGMFALALISGVYYESISSSANLQAKAFNAVDYKGNLTNILSSGNSVTVDSGLSAQIANAQMKLAQCEERFKLGKEKHCEGSKAKVIALKDQSADSLKAGAIASAGAVTAKGDVLKRAVDDQSLPASKWLASSFGISNDGGTMIIVVIAAILFELIHLTTVFTEFKWLEKLKTLTATDKTMQGQYYNTTGKVYNADDFKDDRVIDLSKDNLTPIQTDSEFNAESYEIRTKGVPYSDTKIGFTPQTAKRFKWQDDVNSRAKPEKMGFGFIPSESDKARASLDNTPLPSPPEPYTVGFTEATRANPLKNIDTRLNVPARETNVPARETNVPARETNVPARETLIFQTFEDLPKYPTGCCEWCGCDVSRKRKGARFCSDDHKNRWWNLKKPSNKRTERSF